MHGMLPELQGMHSAAMMAYICLFLMQLYILTLLLNFSIFVISVGRYLCQKMKNAYLTSYKSSSVHSGLSCSVIVEKF